MGIHALTLLTPSAASCLLGHPAPFCPPWPQSPTRHTNPTHPSGSPTPITCLIPPVPKSPSLAIQSRSLGPLFGRRLNPHFPKQASRPFQPTYPCTYSYPPYLQPARSDLHPNVTLHPAPLHRPLLPSPDSHSRHGNSTHFSTLFNTFRQRRVSFLVFLT